MSDIHVDVPQEASVSADYVNKVIDFANKVVMVAKGLAFLTPTTVDDQIVAKAEQFLKWVTPITKETWFAEAVDLVVSLFQKKSAAEVFQALKGLGN